MRFYQRFVWTVFLLVVVVFVCKIEAAEKITLRKGCYTCKPSLESGGQNVLIDGRKQSSCYVDVAGWKTWEPVEIVFDLGKSYSIDSVKLYSCNSKDGKIGVVTLYASQNGQIYTEIGKADNSKAPLNYPKTQIIEIKANGEEAKFVKIKYVSSGGRITQLSEVEIFPGAGATFEKKPTAYALTNQEKLKLLKERFLKGEIDQDLYKELRKKYEGGAAEVSKADVEAKPVQEVAGNLVKNFSFERLSSDGSAEGWTIDESSSLEPVEVSTSDAHGGKNSIKFAARKTKGTKPIFQEIPLKPGKGYRVVFWAKGENLQRDPKADGRPCVVQLDYQAQDGKLKPIYIEPQIGNEWKRVVKTVNIPGDALEGGKISLMLYYASGTLWIDEVVVMPLSW